MGGGSDSPPPAPTFSTYGGQPNYIPQFQTGSDVNLNSLQGNMFGPASTLPGQLAPWYESITSNIVNNPYAAGAQTASNAAGAYAGGTLAPMQQQGAASLQSLGNLGAGAGAQILNTGFDPQQALYDRTQQQVQDQLRATNAMSGLSGTPYGAGLIGQGLSNFNIDWQNAQLGRQATAAQGFGNLVNSSGKGYAGAADLGNAALGAIGQAGALPYGTSLGIEGARLGGVNALNQGITGSYALPQQLIGDYEKYLNLGNTASGTTDSAINSAYSNQLAQFQAQQNANQGMFDNIGGLFGGVSNAFSSGGLFGGGGPGGAGGLFDLSNLFAAAPPALALAG